MFITPKFVREAIADHTGRKAHGIKVRIFAAAGFYALIGLAAGLALGVALCPSDAFAHSGGLAADGCHKDNSVGERHWHLEGTRERGGECVTVDGTTFRYMMPAEGANVDDLVADIEWLESELAGAELYIEDLEALLAAAMSDLSEAQHTSRIGRDCTWMVDGARAAMGTAYWEWETEAKALRNQLKGIVACLE